MGSDFVPAPRDFADQPIGNAIEAKDFKKALKLVEKRLAKKRDPYLLALKRFIQCCHPVVSERGISVAAICDLATRSEATVFSGIEELELYDEALKAAFPDSLGVEGSVICRMRAAAVKAVPKDEKLALACFNACLARDRFEQAQQGLDSTSRKLRNPQELLLLHRLIREHNLPAEERMKRGLDFHENPYVGSTSKAAKGSWELQRNHLLLLEENRSWNTLLKKCVDMLQKVGPHDGATAVDPRGADWQVWRCYLLALVETHSTANEDLVDEEFEHILGLGANLDKTYSRNAALARLELTLSSIYAPPKLTSSNSVKVKDDEKPSKIYRRNASHQVNRLAIYFDDRVSAPSLFADIKPQVEKLNLKDQRVLMLTICNMIRSPFNGATPKIKFWKISPESVNGVTSPAGNPAPIA
ncbi:MAG: hypothetical protein M1818_001729 [Claussenomyces sp. TS43310]|nr:MAG: hypothetical protein M1818_001729 [Claussenomyces sp. TS43310]